MDSSWLSSTIAGLRNHSPGPDVTSRSPAHDRRPRWRSPSPATSSTIPPPIVQSIYVSQSPSRTRVASLSSSATSPHLPERRSWVQRKQRQLEADLQVLLDAQADGLNAAGLNGAADGHDAGLSTGMSTPTTSSVRGGGRSYGSPAGIRSSAVRRADISLRDARRGIYGTMRRLALLKIDEVKDLRPDIEEKSGFVQKIEGWEQKMGLLKERVGKIERGDEAEKAREMRAEADGMQREIEEVEAKLRALKHTQRTLRKEADEVENQVQAKLSRYTSSLDLLNKDMKRFLDGAQEANGTMRSAGSGRSKADEDLQRAKDRWTAELEALQKKQTDAGAEQEALEDGAVVWKDVVKEVTNFERTLQEEMRRLSDPDRGAVTTHELVSRIEETVSQLQSRLELAESKNWKLLMCAIGAELEAFRRGREVLEEALASTERLGSDHGAGHDGDEEDDDAVLSAIRTKSLSPEETRGEGDANDELARLDHAFQGKQRRGNDSTDTDTEEDDGPDPELLISHQDPDTE